MFDRHIPPQRTGEEEMLDRWLDAFNDSTRLAPPAPTEISAIAATARRYHNVLALPANVIPSRSDPIKDGSMPPLTPSTAFLGKPHTVPLLQTGNHVGRRRSLAGGLAGALAMILLIVLAAGPLVREYGWPNGLQYRISLLAPEEDSLTCASPGYRPVVEGESNTGSLAAIGITEEPIQIVGDEIHIPTSSGDVVTLPTTWTEVGGPIWADTAIANGEIIVRNIETDEEWTVPTSGRFFPGVYEDPYLLMPTSTAQNDWRIIDTMTGEERLLSDIRGEPFPAQVDISPIGHEWDQRSAPAAPAIWLFSSYSPPDAGGEPPDLGPNALVLPSSLADAAFLPETVDATYFHETVYSTATQRLAFATGAGTDRAIVVIDPESGARIVVQDERFTDQTLPLTFSDDGSTLIVDQSNAIFSVSLTGDPSVTLVHEADRAFVPIAHDRASMRVLIMFRDRGAAIVDTASGTTTNVPGITIPESPPAYGTFDPLFRMSSNTRIFEMYDDETSTVRFIDLATGSVFAETVVLNPEEDYTDAPIQPQFQYVIPYPYVSWAGSHAFLDEGGALRVVSANDEDSFSIPPPDDFSVDTNQVVDLLVSPGERCVVLTVRQASDVTIIRNGEQIDSTVTWVAPLEPDATWIRLDVALVGWREVYEPPATNLDPVSDIASPAATPLTR